MTSEPLSAWCKLTVAEWSGYGRREKLNGSVMVGRSLNVLVIVGWTVKMDWLLWDGCGMDSLNGSCFISIYFLHLPRRPQMVLFIHGHVFNCISFGHFSG